ncbi:MAG TPA: DoxX family protein [Burkholderiales bacterium]|nr:DoxX family protein [Burkholderiales bacterium]
MSYAVQGDAIGKLVLRLTLGGLILFHGVAKLLHADAAMGMITGRVTALGLPAFVAYGVYVGEVLAPLLLILGVFSRIGGLLVVVNMIFALVLVHTGQIFTLGKTGGWALELQGFYLLCGLTVLLLGSGKYAVKPD